MKVSVQYKQWLKEVKNLITAARTKAVLSVNEQLLLVYWQLGQMIVEKQKSHLWGDAVIEQLSNDLQKSFPEMKGFSRTNLFNCKKWYLFYSDKKVQQLVGLIQSSLVNKKVQQPVGLIQRNKKTSIISLITKIPWGHNIVIIEKTASIPEALFYIKQTIQNGWSRNMLLNQIDNRLYKRTGKSINNFSKTLSLQQSGMANETFKDPYLFDFLSIQKIAGEKNLEDQLINHITKFLIELGKGFAFVGKQYHIEVGKKDYYIDLLFYHLHLRCYVVVELKSGEFKPEFAGKVNFYLSAIDDLVADKKKDNPTIGIILCKEKDSVTAEYAVRGFAKPIGIAKYDFIKSIPKNFKAELPTIAQLEKELKNL